MNPIAPPGVDGWLSDGAWTRLGELHVLELLGVSFVLALVFVIAREIVRTSRERLSH